jgi:alpha-L-arabinofuranosidase
MRGFIDNKLIVTATDEEFPHQLEGYASASYARAAGEVILKVVNTSGEFLETQIDLRGPKKVGSNGRAVVLAGEPSAVNTSRNPTNVVPKVEPLTNAAASFSHTFPPHSVSLLRFPAN